MAFYPQFPQAAIYAYPMPFPNQEFYAMYPPGSQAMEGSTVFYENNNYSSKKPGYNNRKESVQSTDSGLSDNSYASSYSSASSRKTSNVSATSASALSNLSITEEDSEAKEEMPPMEEPNDDLCEQIVQQVEFYFSDANITKDKFLLKHVKRNKEGFVSLKLISSFKRVKHLTKDWRQVAVAIERKSNKLEVNDLKTKVRRLDALPEYDETTPSRTVVALNLPIERPTIEAVAELFKVCGEIVLVRILRPGNPIPADVKPFSNKHPEMTDKVCALVEFEKTEFAHNAVKDLSLEGEEGMKVMELTAPPPKKTKPASEERRKLSLGSAPQSVRPNMQPQRRFSHAGFGMQGGQAPMVVEAKRKISLFHNMKFNPIMEEQNHQEQAQKKEYGLNPNAPSFSMQQQQMYPQQQNFGNGHGRGGRRPSNGPQNVRYIPMDSPMMMMQPVMVAPPRRFSAISAGHAELAVSGLGLPPNVIRMPRGPDKGKGFQRWCNSRMKPEGAPAAPPAVAASPVASAPIAPAAPVQQKQQQPLPQRKSRAIPIVAPPEAAGAAKAEAAAPEPAAPAVEGAAAAAGPAPVAAPAAPVVDRNLVVNLDSSDSDEGHFSDHDLADENERTR